MDTPRDDEVRIIYIGGPTVLLTIGSLHLLTDPTFDPAGYRYLSGETEVVKTISPAVTSAALPRVDAILLSHDQHSDNLDPAGREYLVSAGRVLTTPESAQRLAGNAEGVATWQTSMLTAADGLTIRVTATPARHGSAAVAPAVTGSVTGWMLEWQGQQKGALYISGDTVVYEGVEEVARRYSISAALLHFGAAHVPRLGPDSLTLTAAEGARLALLMPHAAIFPIHYEGWTHLSEGRNAIEQAFAAAGIAERLRFLPPGLPTTLAI